MTSVQHEDAIRGLVRTAVESYAAGFGRRHKAQVNDPNGTLNVKIHNVFIAALGAEIQYYAALVRSLDSSLGKMLEMLAMNIARLFFEVQRHVEAPLAVEQTRAIAEILEQYKRRRKQPDAADYQGLRGMVVSDGPAAMKRHDSDYYLIDRHTGCHYLIELKIGGDLDSKKARSEKEAILEQFAILSNVLPPTTPMRIYFATAYNRFGEGMPWNQERVRQYFAADELLIGEAFWNFVCRSPRGYAIVLGSYREHADLIRHALEEIKGVYLARGETADARQHDQQHGEAPA